MKNYKLKYCFVSSCNSYHILVRYIYVFVIDQFFPCVASVPVPAERNIGPREGVFAFGTCGRWGEIKKSALAPFSALFVVAPFSARLSRGPIFRSCGNGTLATQANQF